MRILTLEDSSYEMNEMPDEVEDDLRFAIFDNSNPLNADYFFIPLVFIEIFNSPAIVLEIQNKLIRLPIDWKILTGEKEYGDLEMINLSSLNMRGFSAFSFNPLSSYRPDFYSIKIIDVYNDVKWFFPRLKPGQLLAIPIETGPNPRCIYCAKEINKQSEIIDIEQAW